LNRTGGERKLDWSAGADKKKPPKKRERGTPDRHRAPASFGSIFKGLWVTPLLSQPEHFPASPWVTPTFELRRVQRNIKNAPFFDGFCRILWDDCGNYSEIVSENC
jgi:hypothetical protein